MIILSKLNKKASRLKTRLTLHTGTWVANIFRSVNHIKQRPRLLLYTDSRGTDITRNHLRHYPFASYPGTLIKYFNVDLVVMPHKHTTLADFIYEYETSFLNYDYVICHVGIVDFAPRSKSDALSIYQLKQHRYNNIFNSSDILNHINKGFDCEFEGEKTANMFSYNMMKTHLIPRLKQHTNLIWVGCNKCIPNWKGNHFRGRPENANQIVNLYSDLLCKELNNTISLERWDEDKIKLFTYDNIHLTKLGENELLKYIIEKIDDSQQQLQQYKIL